MADDQEKVRRDQMLNLMNDLKGESDRAVAVLAAAFLDNLLKDLLVAAAKANLDNIEDLLFANLSSFASRTKEASKLTLLNKDELRDLDLIREIRNEFAHKFIGVTFETPYVFSRCQQLMSAKAGGQPSSARECFIKAAVRLMVDVHLRIQDKTRLKGGMA